MKQSNLARKVCKNIFDNIRFGIKFALNRKKVITSKDFIRLTCNVCIPDFESLGFEFSDGELPRTWLVKLPDGWNAYRYRGGWKFRHFYSLHDEKDRVRGFFYYGIRPIFGEYGSAKLYQRYSYITQTISSGEEALFIIDNALPKREKRIVFLGMYAQEYEDDLEEEEEMLNTACAYLNQHYPDWRNPLAYWD